MTRARVPVTRIGSVWPPLSLRRLWRVCCAPNPPRMRRGKRMAPVLTEPQAPSEYIPEVLAQPSRLRTPEVAAWLEWIETQVNDPEFWTADWSFQRQMGDYLAKRDLERFLS